MTGIPNKFFSRHSRIKGFGLLALLMLAGCSGNDRMDFRACPNVVILGDADRVTRTNPPASTDITNVLYQASLGNIKGGCAYDSDSVGLEFSFDITARAGAALGKTTSVQEEYFIAILDPQGNRLSKRNFTTELVFDPETRRAVATETITPEIPLAEKEDAAGYRVYIGLQLSAQELNKNRQGKE